jgi:RNA polymerase sigma-70 factor (ECF subfamily)
VLTHDASADLVHRAQRGEAKAFTGLVQAFLRPAYSIALSVVGRASDAEDIAQESFLKAFQSIDTCREPERFAGWLFQIVRNRARNHLNSRRLRDVAPEGARILEFVTLPPETAGMRDSLLSALADLDVEKREVVLLHDLENWTHKEIAEALDISEVSSRQQLFQARQILRAKLGCERPKGRNVGSEGNHAK